MRNLLKSLSVIFALFLPLAVSGKSHRIYRDDIGSLKDSIIVFKPAASIIRNTIEVCFSFRGKNEGFFAGQRNLMLQWNKISDDEYFFVTFELKAATMDDMVDTRFMHMEVGQRLNGINEIIQRHDISHGIGLGQEENVALLSLGTDRVEIGIGHRTPTIFFESATMTADPDLPIAVKSTGTVDISEIVQEYVMTQEDERDYSAEIRNILMRATSRIGDEAEHSGIWTYLDRNMDSDYARSGGRYRLVMMPDDNTPDSYLLIYLDGAEINSNSWKRGKLKGKLKATPFVNHYDLIWYDSMHEKIDRDCHADISDEGILTLSFPLLKSTIRFFKE